MVFINQIVTAPIFADEWKTKPPVYYHRIEPQMVQTIFQDDVIYGQYITSTNLLPSDERHIRLFHNNLTEAREYMNNRFTMNDIEFRDNMSYIYKKKLLNRFRHN